MLFLSLYWTENERNTEHVKVILYSTAHPLLPYFKFFFIIWLNFLEYDKGLFTYDATLLGERSEFTQGMTEFILLYGDSAIFSRDKVEIVIGNADGIVS